MTYSPWDFWWEANLKSLARMISRSGLPWSWGSCDQRLDRHRNTLHQRNYDAAWAKRTVTPSARDSVPHSESPVALDFPRYPAFVSDWFISWFLEFKFEIPKIKKSSQRVCDDETNPIFSIEVYSHPWLISPKNASIGRIRELRPVAVMVQRFMMVVDNDLPPSLLRLATI